MKHSILVWSVLGVWSGSAMCASAGAPFFLDEQPGSTCQEWRFESAVNPAPPEPDARAVAGAQAEVAPGEFSMGWQRQVPGLGDAIGLWDLGRNGSVTVTLPADTTAAKRILVQVSQWLDGAIYREFAAVSVPGATYVGAAEETIAFASVGGWVVDQSLWEVEAGTAANSVLVQGAHNGSVVDAVLVEIAPDAQERALLSVQRVDGPENSRVDISWPAAAGNGTIEWSADLANPAGWTPVEAKAELIGDHYFLGIELDSATRFFRLRQP